MLRLIYVNFSAIDHINLGVETVKTLINVILTTLLGATLSCGKSGGSDSGGSSDSSLCYKASTTTCANNHCVYLVSLDDCEYGANFGGIAGADEICNNVLPTPLTSAKALLGINGEREAPSTDWPFAPSTEYFTPDGTSIGTTTSGAVFTFPLSHGFSSSGAEVWTGLETSWGPWANCSGWTSAEGGDTGQVGIADLTNSQSIDRYLQNCDRVDPDLICVGQ